jgi:cobalt-zinc-cadmium efflux system outer membrane protein
MPQFWSALEREEKIMKLSILALTIASAITGTAWAQSLVSPKPQSASTQCMDGMVMPGCPQVNVSPSTRGLDTHPTKTLQEPENPAKHTGENLPAPELLKDVAKRPAMASADFEAVAEANNPTLKQASALVRQSQAQARQAGLYPNPTAGYQGEQIRGGSYGGGEQGGFVQQTIVLGGKLGLRRSVYEQQSKSDQIGVEEQTSRVRNDVQHAFYDALAAQAAVGLRQRLLGVALETVHQLANVGQADAPDILQTEVESEQAKIDYEAAQREYLAAFHALAARAGNAELPASPLKGDLEQIPDLNTEQIVDRIVSDSPTVKRAEQETLVAHARLKDAKREDVPDLQLRAGEQYNGEQVITNPVKPVGAQSFATAGINIPLWNRNQGNIEAAKAEIERAEQDAVRERLRLRQQAEPIAQSYLSAKFEAERYKTQLIPRAIRAYELYLEKYQNMAQAYPQVLISQRTLFQLQIGYLKALHDAWQSATSLENYTLSGGLDAPMSGGSPASSINLPNGGGAQE